MVILRLSFIIDIILQCQQGLLIKMTTNEHGSSSTVRNRRKAQDEKEEEPDVNGYDFPFPSEQRENRERSFGIANVLEELFYADRYVQAARNEAYGLQEIGWV